VFLEEVRMVDIIGSGKRFLTNKLASQAVKLFGSASPKTLAKLASLLERIASTADAKEIAANFRHMFETDHPLAKWFRRVSKEVSPRCRDGFISTAIMNSMFLGQSKRTAFREQEGFLPPNLIVISATMRCNFKCPGCWAAEYSQVPDLGMDLLEKVITEGRDDMGIYFWTITGGEPFIRKDLLDLYDRFSDCFFHIYTNGVLITDEVADRIAALGNVAPMVSVEGLREATDKRRGEGAWDRIISVMKRLKERGIFFGFSATSTRDNVEEVTGDDFIDTMIDLGCMNGWYFQYIPIGHHPNPSMMLTAHQRDMSRKNVYRLRESKPIVLADFWNDGPTVGGCMAGGKRYLHINAKGDVEPCVFAHFACDNIRDKSLRDALKSPFMRAVRGGIPYDGNLLRACMIIDRPEVLREYFERYGVRPTHDGAETIVTSLSSDIDRYAGNIAPIFDHAWQNGDIQKVYGRRDSCV
jgi:MoaA/NifB/PqqE/SkfB family radical SAM enzyme